MHAPVANTQVVCCKYGGSSTQVVNHTKLFAVKGRLLNIVNDQGNIHIRHSKRRMRGIGQEEEEYEEPEI